MLAHTPALFAPLLFLVAYLWDGMRRLGGIVKRLAFTSTRSTGTSADQTSGAS